MRTSLAPLAMGLAALLGTAGVHARLARRQQPPSERPVVAAGPFHTIAVRTDGTVLTWGDNDKGQLGSGTVDAVNVRREATVVRGVSGAVAAAAGEKFALVLLGDGSVMSWGDNSEGQLGLGPTGVLPRPGQAMPPVPVPSRVTGLTGVRQIAAGLRFALALREDGTVVAWGDGRLGALGDGKGTGSGSHYAVPFPRPVIGLSNVVGIAAGSEFGLALRADGSVWGWGANEYGQMGDDAVDFKAVPVRLAGVTNVRTLHGAGQSALALLKDGTVVAWGRNSCGLLGVPSTELPKSAKPVPIRGLTGVRQLGTSSTACHALAVLNDGAVRAWGDNSYEELSNGPWVGGLVTVPIQGVAATAAGGYRSLYVMPDGRVLTTGIRLSGLLARVPREITTLDPATVTRCTIPAAGPAGAWSFSRDAVLQVPAIPPAEQTAALTRATAFRTLLIGPYYPDAVLIESTGQRQVGEGRPVLFGSIAFGFDATYLMSVCDTASGAMHEIGSAGSTASLTANDLQLLIETFGEPVEMGGTPVQLFTLARRDGTLGGYPAFRPNQGRALLVTRDGELPYTTVTRGEFLDALERHSTAEGSSASAELVETIRQFEAQIEETRKELSGTMRDQVVAEMEKALAEMKARLPANQAKLGAGVNEDVADIRRYRERASAADLARPAVLASFGFRGAFSDGDAEAREIVRLNPQYFARSRTSHDTQLLVLSWNWSVGNPQDEAWRTRFESTFPFDRLNALIDR